MVFKRDLRNFFRFSYWIAVLMISYLIDLLIMANTLNNIIVGLDYLRFFGPGITLVSAFSAGFLVGRKIHLEKEEEFDYYLLSLPIKRLDFILGRAIAGAFQGFIYSLPLLITTCIIVRIPSPLEILLIVLFIWIFSLSMTCLAIIIASILRGSRNFTLARSIVYLWLMFGSTIFYPVDLISSYFPPIAIMILQFNPMSFAVNFFRAILFQTIISPFDVIGVIIFMILMVFLGIYAYDRSTNK
jgi:ABC-type polysaccharide/polyol phosphate export permease